MSKKKDEIRDIYQSTSTDFEKDFTPQVAQEMLASRQRDLRRSRLVSLCAGALVIVLSVALVAVVLRNFLSELNPAVKVRQEEKPFIPSHTLPADALWVMDYQTVEDKGPDEEPGQKPLSTKWVKKAAFHIIMGQQALALSEPKAALEHFQKVVDIYPDIKGLHRSVGMLYLQQDNFALAAEYLEKALVEEESFDVTSNLGTAYIGTEEYEKAEKNLKRALELQPESPVCHKNLAVLYRTMKRDNDAVFHFEKYLDLRPNDLDTMQTYALYLTKLGRWKEAADFLTELTREVTDVAPVYFLLAQVQVQNGQPDKAIAALKRGIQLIDPEQALAWMNSKEFNAVRDSADFKKMVDQLEIATVSLDRKR
jgi:tetratricopeptide (TPR) repeat protein